ncbi:MAG: GNAT family N-acetyltransferase [Deltaproteobacteria bacterium]|nr:GNAT family N-acetyltransferase [Deltaproteobacteria bacterium]
MSSVRNRPTSAVRARLAPAASGRRPSSKPRRTDGWRQEFEDGFVIRRLQTKGRQQKTRAEGALHEIFASYSEKQRALRLEKSISLEACRDVIGGMMVSHREEGLFALHAPDQDKTVVGVVQVRLKSARDVRQNHRRRLDTIDATRRRALEKLTSDAPDTALSSAEVAERTRAIEGEAAAAIGRAEKVRDDLLEKRRLVGEVAIDTRQDGMAGSGLGRRLMNFAITWAAYQPGMKELRFEVDCQNAPMIRLGTDLGFVRRSSEDNQHAYALALPEVEGGRALLSRSKGGVRGDASVAPTPTAKTVSPPAPNTPSDRTTPAEALPRDEDWDGGDAALAPA